ncbi:MAG: hypothetical protein DWQ07_25515 [Chloroflexi bacterium]|nr:MAG: hypothetical protein DWQ07_25515 [Chloroflexota bacterium]MBL1197176.1 hypothetical protein [Chloroflexota bacterium]NOH14470.1 hypothetical protein [Chloroflexota bacterium]
MARKRITLVVEEAGLEKLNQLAEDMGLSKGTVRRFAFGWGVYLMQHTSEELVKVVKGEPVKINTEEEIRQLIQYTEEPEEGEEDSID